MLNTTCEKCEGGGFVPNPFSTQKLKCLDCNGKGTTPLLKPKPKQDFITVAGDKRISGIQITCPYCNGNHQHIITGNHIAPCSSIENPKHYTVTIKEHGHFSNKKYATSRLDNI